NSASAHEQKGGLLVEQGRPEEGMSEAERALSLDPARPIAYLFMGTASIALGLQQKHRFPDAYQYDNAVGANYEKALDFIDKAIRLSPHDPSLNDLYTCKALAYNELGQYDQAIEWGRRSIASNPSSGGYETLGRAYVETGQFEKSLEFYDK